MAKAQLRSQDYEPAVLYLRKSREDQEAEARGEGETLDKHRKALFRLSKEMNINIARVYEEIVSGESLLHRPEMLQLLKDIEAGMYRSVFVMDVDRLGRGNMQEQGLILETFKAAKTKIITPRKVYDLLDEFDEEYSEFEAFMARKELKLITRRLQGGRVRSVEDGNYIGTIPPYGYLINKEGQSRYLIPHPEQADVVKMIFGWYTHEDSEQQMGTSKIAHELNRLGYFSYTGIPWAPSSVLSIIKNAVYAGRMQWKKKEIKKSADPNKVKDTRTRPRTEWIDAKGKHESLVSWETFQKAQEILKGKYHRPYLQENGLQNPLAGLIRCDFCGASMYLRKYSTQNYPHIMCRNGRCTNRSSRFEYVERRILEGLKDLITSYRNQWAQNAEIEAKQNDVIDIRRKMIERLEKELGELEKQKNRLHDFLERKIYDEDTYLERSRNLSDRIENTRLSIQTARDELEKELQRELNQKDIIPRLENVLELYTKLDDPLQKNQLMKTILESAVYKKEQDQRNDNFALVLYPKLTP